MLRLEIKRSIRVIGKLEKRKYCLKFFLTSIHNLIFVIWNYYLFKMIKGWFTPGQMFVLDEYCARYGVRGCYRHLKYMEDLLEKCEKNVMIDPTLFHLSYAYCASHVHGNR